jgi:glutaredoxin
MRNLKKQKAKKTQFLMSAKYQEDDMSDAEAEEEEEYWQQQMQAPVSQNLNQLMM